MSKRNPKVVRTASRCCVWDFTMYLGDADKDPDGDTYTIVIEMMNIQLLKYTKRYAFQLERGEKAGKLHFQGRFSLKEKLSKSDLLKMLNDDLGWSNYHISPTSNENRTNDFYVIKDDTRVEGPFTDENYVLIPRDVRAMVNLRPWQKSLKEILQELENRIIDVMVEGKGNIGKTLFCRYMAIKCGAQILPFCNDYQSVMRMAYDVGAKPIYMIDIPRGIPQKKLAELYSALESLKGGYAYDDRNRFRDRYFDPPRVIVFCNTMPDFRYLSQDRWKLWEVDDNMNLRPHGQRDEYNDNESIGFDSNSDDDY